MNAVSFPALMQGALVSCPLFVIWWLLLSTRVWRKLRLGRHKRGRGIALTGVVILCTLVFALISRYVILLAWVFTLACVVGAIFRAERMWVILTWGALMVAFVHLVQGPKIQEMERRGRRALHQRADEERGAKAKVPPKTG